MNTPFLHSRRLVVLVSLLCAAIAGLAIVRWRTLSRPDHPQMYASTPEKIRFYSQRIKSDPADIRAYVELGKLEESQEFYISALRRLTIARALGAPDRDIVLPMGRSLSHLARWDEARAELEKAVRLMPDSVEAATNLAGVFYASGDAGQASATLNDFVRGHRSAAGAVNLPVEDLRRLMFCFSEAKDTDGAGRMATDILRVDPTDVGALSIAGHSLIVAGKYRQALPYLEKAVAREPNAAALCYNYGTALAQCGNEEAALRQFQRCVVLNSNATDAFMQMANIYERRKNWKLAAIALSNVAVQSRSNFKVLYRAGKANERAGNKVEADYWYSCAALVATNYAEALGYAKKLAQSADPTWRSSGLANMADAYRGLHQMKEYLATVQQQANRNTADDLVRLAAAYEKCDLLDKQIATLRRAIAMDPRQAPQIHFTIAETMLRRGLRDDAEKELEAAAAGDPQNASVHTELGNLYLERRSSPERLKKAVAEFEQTVRIDPKNAAAYQKLGIACAAANDLGHAAAYLEHAIDLEPGYGPSYEELGRVYAKMGDKSGSDMLLSLYRRYVRYDETLKNLSAKADQNKSDPGAQLELADLLVRTGDYGGALDRYALALQLKPKDAAIRRKYDRVVALVTRANVTQSRKPPAGAVQ
jgi:tetratricopeptide (TPR) repeat protein